MLLAAWSNMNRNNTIREIIKQQNMDNAAYLKDCDKP